jgi:transposase-like protein
VITVGWYRRDGLSYLDVEELLAERGAEVEHVPVYRWVQRFIPLFADAARQLRHAGGDRWFVDETVPAQPLRLASACTEFAVAM